MANGNDDALDALRKHNDELTKLLSAEGRTQLDRLVFLETALHAYASGSLEHIAQTSPDALADHLLSAIPELGQEQAQVLAANLQKQANEPGIARQLLGKIGSVANSFVKKKAGGWLGGGDDEE